MNFGFFVDPDTTRHCYVRLRRLKKILDDPRAVDGLADELELPAATGESRRHRKAAIERRIEALRGDKQSLWYEVPAPEVLAALVFGARKRMPEVVDELFSAVDRPEGLTAPLVGWLNLGSFVTRVSAAPGTGRANLIGYRGGQFMAKSRIVTIEPMIDADELDRALDEREGARSSAHASYVACTPAVAAGTLWARMHRPSVRHWDADALAGPLKASGRGLLLVEGDAVAQVTAPLERKPDNATVAELLKVLQSTGTPPTPAGSAPPAPAKDR